MCPDLAPLFLQSKGVNNHDIFSNSVNPDALPCLLTLKMVNFNLFGLKWSKIVQVMFGLCNVLDKTTRHL